MTSKIITNLIICSTAYPGWQQDGDLVPGNILKNIFAGEDVYIPKIWQCRILLLDIHGK